MDDSFDDVWRIIRERLDHQPFCQQHPEHRCIATLVEDGYISDILSVDERVIVLQSHHPKANGPRRITVDCFKKWWDHLLKHKTASVAPGMPGEPNRRHPNNPARQNSCIVGA